MVNIYTDVAQKIAATLIVIGLVAALLAPTAFVQAVDLDLCPEEGVQTELPCAVPEVIDLCPEEGVQSEGPCAPVEQGNPELGGSCGLDMILVLDSSDSMSDGDIQDVKDAANGLVTALSGTPVQFGVIDFDSTVISSLAPTTDTVAVTDAVNSIGHTGATEFTNWDAALGAANGMAGSNDLVVIITDGNPTVSDGAGSDLQDAIDESDDVQGDNTRILAIGIDSSGTQGGLDVDNLKAISGDQVVNFPAAITSINDVDVATGDISDLGPVLADLATALCGGTITVNKIIDADGNLETTDDQTAGEGWNFTVGEDEVTTDENGQTVAVDVESGSYTVTEIAQEGYTFVSAVCLIGEDSVGSLDGAAVYGVDVADDEVASCVFINTPEREPEPEVLACSLSSDKSEVEEGEAFNLTWTTDFATAVSIDNGIGNVDFDGSVETSVENDTTFTLTATRGEGDGLESVTCNTSIAIDEDNGGGGSSSGSKKRSGGGGSSNDNDGEVLGATDGGEQTAILPAGAPNAGAGGAADTSAGALALVSLATMLLGAVGIRRIGA